MGYEYDYVFDWMVKKPTIQGALTTNAENEKQAEGEPGTVNANESANNLHNEQTNQEDTNNQNWSIRVNYQQRKLKWYF